MHQMKTKGIYSVCVISVSAMLLLSAAVALILPVFILNEYLPIEYTEIAVIISIGMAAFIGVYIAGKMINDGGMWIAALSVMVYYVLIIFGAIFFNGGLNTGLLYEILAGAGGGVTAWLVLTKRKKPCSKRKNKRRNR